MYLLPLWGILHRSAEQPATFLGMELWTLALPWPVVHLVGVVALVTVALWIATRVRAWRAGRHLASRCLGYCLMPTPLTS